MRSRFVGFASLVLVLILAGCGGKGVDKNIATDSEASYRKTLDEAWQDMTSTQHEAYNWAVSNFTLDQLIAKYPTITPRNVIESEADQYIARHTAEIAKTTASLAENAQRLANDEQHLAVATAELNKITVKPIGFVINNDFFKRRNFEYVVQNDSQYDISLVTFSAWVFVDGEERSERSCRVWGVFQHRGGLQKGKSLKVSFDPDRGFDCRSWNTLEVKNAKNLSYRFDVDLASAKDFGEKRILPELSQPVRSDYEQAIKQSEEAIAAALTAKASLVSSSS